MATTKKTILKHIRLYKKLEVVRKEATNEANKEKTKLKNALVAFLRDGKHAVGTALRVEDSLYTYGTSESSVIPPDAWLRMWEKGYITKEQFLEAISVAKGVANNLIGQDQVKHIEQVKKSSTADLRTEKVPYNSDKETKTQVVVPKLNIRNRRVKPVKLLPKLRRKIKLRG